MSSLLRGMVFALLLPLLGAETSGVGEDFAGLVLLVYPPNVTVYGVVLDRNNRTNTNVRVQVCWDDPTYRNNCDAPVLANTDSEPTVLCAAGSVCHGFKYVPPPGNVGAIVPRDGNDHLMYIKVLSQSNPGAGDKPLEGSPWPFSYKGGTVGPMWTPKLEAAPGRLSANQLALFANSQDRYSVGSSGATVCTVGSTAIKDDGVVGYYALRHKVPCANLFVVSLPLTNYIPQATLEATVLATRLPSSIQAIGLGWVQPAQVSPTLTSDGPRSISAVVANGAWMKGSPATCGGSALLGQGPINPYFNSSSKAPYTDHGLRPTMLLAGEACPACAINKNNYTGPWIADVPTAKATIDAAMAAVDTNPRGNVYWAWTSDVARNLTAVLVSPLLLGGGISPMVNAQVLGSITSPTSSTVSARNILLYDQASANWLYSGATFLPGAGIGFAVTSTSGFLPYDGNQTNAASWLQAGAVAAFGSAIEPCNVFPYKHPDADILISNYLQGQTVVEALWKSVRLPWVGNFVGDPLASPFSLGAASPTVGPAISSGGVVNGASFVPGPVSPGAVLSVFGANLGPNPGIGGTFDAPAHVSAIAGGTRVLINGTAAPILYASEGQVNTVVPFGTPSNVPAQVVVEYNGAQSPPEPVSVADSSPAVFTLGNSQGAILNENLTVNGTANPAAQGSIVVIYATGAGLMNPAEVDGQISPGVFSSTAQPVSVRIGGQDAVIKYAGAAPGIIAGVIQVNAVVPLNIPSGVQPIVIQAGSAVSPASVTVAIQ